nr:hypothetical protein [Tanacetum cinerariifolium]
MLPRMMTQSAGGATIAPRGGRTGGQTSRGGGRTRGRSGDQGNGRVPDFSTIIAQQLQNLLLTILAQVGNQGNNQGDDRNQNGNVVNDNMQGLAMLRILIDLMSWLEPMTIQKAVKIAGTLIDEAIRNGSIKRTTRREEMGENLARIGMGRVITRELGLKYFCYNHVRRENTSTTPKCTTCNFYHPSKAPCRACFNYNHPGHLAKDYRVVPRNVNLINARNPTAARGACFECGGTNHYKSACTRLNRACGKAFMSRAEESRQDSNIMTGTFTLNNHYATTLFDSSTDYSFVSTTCIPLLGIEPSDLRFSYEIEIASGQLVEIDKVTNGCKLEIDCHVFDINLIPFGSKIFDVIIGMDWLSNRKAEIIYHEKVVRLPLLDGMVLRVLGERPKEKARHLMSAKANEQKQEVMVVIELVPRAIPITKSPYRLAPSEMEELSGQPKNSRIKFLGHVINRDGIHVDPSKIEAVKNWEAPKTPSEGDVRTLIMDKAYKLKYSIHPRDNKMYYDLRDRYGVPISIISDRDSCFILRFWQTMQEALGTKLDMSMAYHPQTDGQSERTIQTLEDMLRACVLDFGGKLAPRFVKPFEITEHIGLVAYKLRLPEELNGVHDTFYVSNLKKCLTNLTLQVPLDKIQVDAKLNFVEEPMKIFEREFKKLKWSRISIVKVRWNSKRGPEFTWEGEDQMRLKYPHLFSCSSS